jgi:hypothetical protein
MGVPHFRIPPRRKRDLRSFGVLRSVEWFFRTDVSGQSVGPIVKGQAVHELFYFKTPTPTRRIFIPINIKIYQQSLVETQ